MNEIVFGLGFTTFEPTKKQVRKGLIAEHANARAFYDLTAKYSYMDYTQQKKKVCKIKDCSAPACDQNILDNSGVFNNKKVLSKEEVAKLKENIGKTESIIWHGYISFNAEQTKRFVDQQSCVNFLNHTISALFEGSHINMKNIELFASLHTDTSNHHHIHFSYFEKEPSRKGKDGKATFSQKGNFEKQNLDNFMISAGLYLEDTKENYHVARDMAIDELRKVSQVIKKDESLAEVKRQLIVLANKLPKVNAYYNSKKLPQDIKNDVDSIAQQIILSNSGFAKAYRKALEEIAIRKTQVERTIRENKMVVVNQGNVKEKEMKYIHDDNVQAKNKYIVDTSSGIAQIDNLKADLRGRVGNEILKIAKSIKGGNQAFRKYNNTAFGKQGKNTNRIRARVQRGIAEKELWKLLHKKVMASKTKTDFSVELHKAEREIEKQHSQEKIG